MLAMGLTYQNSAPLKRKNKKTETFIASKLQRRMDVF